MNKRYHQNMFNMQQGNSNKREILYSNIGKQDRNIYFKDYPKLNLIRTMNKRYHQYMLNIQQGNSNKNILLYPNIKKKYKNKHIDQKYYQEYMKPYKLSNKCLYIHHNWNQNNFSKKSWLYHNRFLRKDIFSHTILWLNSFNRQ